MSYAAPYNAPSYAARAVADWGDDFTRASVAQYKIDEDERKNKERIESSERLQRERLEAAMAQVEARIAPKVKEMDEEYMAARSGRTVPEIQAARDFAKKGPQTRAEWGETYGPGDRPEDAGSDRQQYQTPESAKAQSTWEDPMVRRGIMESKINPQYWDQAAKGQNEGDAGDMTLRADSIADAKDGARRIHANKGLPERRVDDHQEWNPYDSTDPTKTTEAGKSNIEKDKSVVAKNSRSKGGDDGEIRTNSAAYGSAKETVADTRAEIAYARARVDKLRDATPPEPKKMGETQGERASRITSWEQSNAKAIERAEQQLAEAQKKHDAAVKVMNEVGQGNKKADRSTATGEGKKGPPSASVIPGFPKGGAIRSFVPGKGWEVVVNGKVVAYAQDK
jgi:hypothetical protein